MDTSHAYSHLGDVGSSHITRRSPGDPHESLDDLVAFAYHELRAIAHDQLAAHDGGGTLSTTALVQQAYLELVDRSPSRWRDRAHFIVVASLAMRRVLVDCAKARVALGSARQRPRISLDDDIAAIDDQAAAVLQIDDALEQLGHVEPRLAKVVEYRFFGGLTDDEIAGELGTTARTVRRDWVKARIMLRHALES